MKVKKSTVSVFFKGDGDLHTKFAFFSTGFVEGCIRLNLFQNRNTYNDN